MSLAWVLKHFHQIGVQDDFFLAVSRLLHCTNQLLSLPMLKSKPLIEEMRGQTYDMMVTAATHLTEIEPLNAATPEPLPVRAAMAGFFSMDDDPHCGNEIHNLWWLLHHHGPGPWPPKETIDKTLNMLRAVGEYFAACQITNKAKRTEMRIEASKSLMQTVQRFGTREKAVAA